VPLIISSGAGAAARYSMGLVIFSGILVGTMFTLFVVPMFYTFISARELRQEAEDEAATAPVHA
ncbi:MAG: efflux RND transporter permease subunit, partial [Oricola sp.]|nr:efflux RND transporter permease subunit [Oricola sp.]